MEFIGYVLMERTSYDQKFVRIKFNNRIEVKKWHYMIEDLEYLEDTLDWIKDPIVYKILKKWFPYEDKEVLIETFGLSTDTGELTHFISADWYQEISAEGLFVKIDPKNLVLEKYELDVIFAEQLSKVIRGSVDNILIKEPVYGYITIENKDIFRMSPYFLDECRDMVVKNLVLSGYEVVQTKDGWKVKA